MRDTHIHTHTVGIGGATQRGEERMEKEMRETHRHRRVWRSILCRGTEE